MSTGVIVAIVVAALILVGLVIALIARARSGERALERRRNEAAAASRQDAELKVSEAERAEHRARLAEAEAERHRAESRLHGERAEAYEQGLADDHLRDDEAPPEDGDPEVASERARA
jgi:flagellar biosynthesis/type III secretory pathway M-ring protein FliF/YscJ